MTTNQKIRWEKTHRKLVDGMERVLTHFIELYEISAETKHVINTGDTKDSLLIASFCDAVTALSTGDTEGWEAIYGGIGPEHDALVTLLSEHRVDRLTRVLQ